jgi:uncharacterized protein YcbK (DUF882 family)
LNLNCNRRDFLKLGAGALTVGVLPLPALASTLKTVDARRRTLSFYNTHTRETIDIRFFDQGEYCPEALNQANYILRDHRSREVHPIDLRLLNTLYAVKLKIRPKTPFYIISGYRSPATNEMLYRSTSGVSLTSYHTKGRAIDIRLPGYSSRRLRDVCIALKSGGVGYYGNSDFVHLDTGPIRTW